MHRNVFEVMRSYQSVGRIGLIHVDMWLDVDNVVNDMKRQCIIEITLPL